jgi:uncharacterized SAM-binding protein YcdF (DUF218 family)
MHFLKQVIENAVSPEGLLILLFAVGLLLTLIQRNLKLRNRLFLAGASLYILFTFSPLAEITIGLLERRYPPLLKPKIGMNASTIVVLSGYGEEHLTTPVTSNLSEETVCRLVEGIRLYHQIPNAKLLMSGGSLRKGHPAAALIMAEFVKAMGIPARDILVEGKSQNTYENLVEVRRLLGPKPFLLVTSAYHLPRAMAIARRLQMEAVAAPAMIWTRQHFPPDMHWFEWSLKILQSFSTPSQARLIYLQRACHELIGYRWYQLLGRL